MGYPHLLKLAVSSSTFVPWFDYLPSKTCGIVSVIASRCELVTVRSRSLLPTPPLFVGSPQPPASPASCSGAVNDRPFQPINTSHTTMPNQDDMSHESGTWRVFQGRYALVPEDTTKSTHQRLPSPPVPFAKPHTARCLPSTTSRRPTVQQRTMAEGDSTSSAMTVNFEVCILWCDLY